MIIPGTAQGIVKGKLAQDNLTDDYELEMLQGNAYDIWLEVPKGCDYDIDIFDHRKMDNPIAQGATDAPKEHVGVECWESGVYTVRITSYTGKFSEDEYTINTAVMKPMRYPKVANLNGRPLTALIVYRSDREAAAGWGIPLQKMESASPDNGIAFRVVLCKEPGIHDALIAENPHVIIAAPDSIWSPYSAGLVVASGKKWVGIGMGGYLLMQTIVSPVEIDVSETSGGIGVSSKYFSNSPMYPLGSKFNQRINFFKFPNTRLDFPGDRIAVRHTAHTKVIDEAQYLSTVIRGDTFGFWGYPQRPYYAVDSTYWQMWCKFTMSFCS